MADATIVIAETNASVVVTSDTSATISVTETTANITTSNVGIQGATGDTGVGYSGVTSTSNLTIGTGLKTFTLVSGNSGAFVTGQRIRAIHSETPTYWMEGYANYIGGGTLIITVDLTAGSGTHNLWNFAIAGQVGATGATGATGSSGVISVTAPITNSGTSTAAQLGFDATGFVKTSDTGTVTSTMIADGTILNADINASAAIAATKISGTAAVLGSANSFTVGGHTITAESAAIIPLRINGASGQTGNLQEWRNFGGTLTTFVNASGSFRIGTNIANTAVGLNLDYAGGTTGLGLVIKGNVGQTANLQEWQNSGSTVVASITSSGQFINTISIANNDYLNRTNGGNARLQLLTTGATLTASVATNIILTLQNTNASPTADLLRFLNTGSTVLTAITSAGTINFASGNTSATATAGAITAPALVTGFITMQVAGTTVKVPYYSN